MSVGLYTIYKMYYHGVEFVLEQDDAFSVYLEWEEFVEHVFREMRDSERIACKFNLLM